MKKIKLTLLIFASVALLINACKPTTVLTKVDKSKITQSFKIKVSETAVFSLKTNASTGYFWTITPKFDEKILTLDKHEVVNDKEGTGIVGAGATETWTFKGLKKGKAYLHLVYARAEENAQNKDEKYYEIIVE